MCAMTQVLVDEAGVIRDVALQALFEKFDEVCCSVLQCVLQGMLHCCSVCCRVCCTARCSVFTVSLWEV